MTHLVLMVMAVRHRTQGKMSNSEHLRSFSANYVAKKAQWASLPPVANDGQWIACANPKGPDL